MIICFTFMFTFPGVLVANDNLTETRYCGEPSRNINGSIKRSSKVRYEFERLYPLPIGYHRNEWQIDHVIPLERGGCDSISNMQWLPKSIKTCADDDCKDRWERSGIYPKGVTKQSTIQHLQATS